MSEDQHLSPITREEGESLPDFVAQSAEPMTPEDMRQWFQARADEFRARGATWMRATVDDADNPKICLMEGWLVRPRVKPKPYFMMTKASHGAPDA